MGVFRAAARAGRRCMAGAMLLLGSSGCLVGPQYHRPQVSLNSGWSTTTDPRIAAQAAVNETWWRTFNDPTLDRLVDTAFRQNIALQIAGTRIFAARAQLGIAETAQYPTNPSPIANAQAGGVVPYGSNPSLFYGGYQLGFDAAWEPDFWGKYRRGARAANASYMATVADYDGALVSLTAEVARTYVTIRTFQELLTLTQANVRIQEEGLQVAQSRFSHGATSGLDVSQATYLLESTRATVPELQSGLQQSENALCTLLGQTTGCVQDLLADHAAIPTVPAQVAVGIPADLLRRRPDIRSAELNAIAQCDRIGVAVAEYYPGFDLLGSLGTRSIYTTGGSASVAGLISTFNPGAFLFSLGASAIWPILSYPRIRNNVRLQDARFQEALFNYQNTVLSAAQEVEDGITGYLLEQEAVRSAQNASSAAQDAVQLALVQYREGAVDYQRVLDTQRALLQSQATVVRARSSTVTNLVALYKALGGGWEIRQGLPVVSDDARAEMQRRTNWGDVLSNPRPAGQTAPAESTTPAAQTTPAAPAPQQAP